MLTLSVSKDITYTDTYATTTITTTTTTTTILLLLPFLCRFSFRLIAANGIKRYGLCVRQGDSQSPKKECCCLLTNQYLTRRFVQVDGAAKLSTVEEKKPSILLDDIVLAIGVRSGGGTCSQTSAQEPGVAHNLQEGANERNRVDNKNPGAYAMTKANKKRGGGRPLLAMPA